MKIFYSEPFLIERIEKAKAKAQFIKSAKDVETVEDAEMVMRMVLSRYYKIPFFDEYFEKRTIDELFFEVELIKEESGNTTETVSQMTEQINNDKDLRDGLVEAMDKEWNEVPLDDGVENDPFFNMARDFMNSGKFAGEEQQPPQKEKTEDDWE